MIAYVLLAGAIVCEIVATLSLKVSEGFSKLPPSLLVVIGYVCSFTLLGLALNRGLPVSVGYAIWAAAGTTIVAILGVVFFRESLSGVAIAGLALIVVGVGLLNLGSTGHGTSSNPASDDEVSTQSR
ncbi:MULTISPECIES: DMT family transporter [Rhodococcus]|uniref:SMR family transporter n=1 Tax=Rhodococcus jostii TaxID=132919 RepID=A0ABU4CEE9_RHOJO|nr:MULTISPECIES: SMR family transporter [Rhodococcus]MDI9948067.1 SMR family transporter [Rhodococcus sp. IEGM 1305]MDV6281808.1 SMR family transporter [Rhodococcus jostii]